MKSNKRLFKAVLLISGILIIIATGFLYSIRLEEPLFFRHYYDELISSHDEEPHHEMSDFSYITNRYDERVVDRMTFPEEPDITIQVSRDNHFDVLYYANNQVHRSGNIVGHYSVKKVNWEIVDVPEDMKLDNTLITQVRFFFDDSSEMLVDIGEVYLSRHGYNETPVEHIYGSSSTDGDIETKYVFKENATIVSVNSPTLASIPHTQSLKLNDKVYESLEGVRGEKGDTLMISSVVLPAEENDYDLYKSQLQVVFRNDAGEESEGILQWVTSAGNYYEFFDLISYIETRRGDK